jgi:sec-independent protein translocase protein TatB
MIDFGFDKIALIGAVALIVIGPEKLPRVARTVGHFLGKAQRYVADVKAEVNRTIELEELQKMKSQFDVDSAARALEGLSTPNPEYKHPKKNWRLKRGAMPSWYKQRAGIRTKALSGAARVARYRPKPLSK